MGEPKTPDMGDSHMAEDAAPDTGTEDPTDTDEPAVTVEQLQAEIDKWKGLSRKHEEKSKANAQAQKELERLRQESMTEQERAVDTARAEARAEALREVGAARVGDAFRVAAAGKGLDVDTLLEGVNLAGFLGEDGQPDADKVAGWVDRIAPAPTEQGAQVVPDLGQGARGTQQVPGLNSSQLEKDLRAKLGIS